MFRTIFGFTGVLTLSLLAAGCGGSGPEAESPTSPTGDIDAQADSGSGTDGSETDGSGAQGLSPGTGSQPGADNGAGAPAGGEGVSGN